MDGEGVRTRREGTVLVITMERPPVNALDTALLRGLLGVFEGEAEDDVVGAVVLAAAGRTWVAGADIRSFAEHDADAGAHPSMRLGNDLFNLIEAFPKVVIAAVNGACLGGGAELALACDLRIASTAATFGQPEIRLGLVPAWGALQRLPRLVGRGRALDLLLSGRTIGAEEALSWGLVTEVVAPEALLPRALERAREATSHAPLAVARTKERVARGQGEPQGGAIREDEWAFNDLLETEDAKEGLAAFLEKRPPVWRGR